jgi:hypothetical protein
LPSLPLGQQHDLGGLVEQVTVLRPPSMVAQGGRLVGNGLDLSNCGRGGQLLPERADWDQSVAVWRWS